MGIIHVCQDRQLAAIARRFAYFVSSRRRHTRFDCDWSSDVCSSDLGLDDAHADEIGSPDGSPEQHRGQRTVRGLQPEIDRGERRDGEQDSAVRRRSHEGIEPRRPGPVQKGEQLDVDVRADEQEKRVALSVAWQEGGQALRRLAAPRALCRRDGVYRDPTRGGARPRGGNCGKLGKELPGLDFKPWNNELGQRIYDSISQDAWKMWLDPFQLVMNA